LLSILCRHPFAFTPQSVVSRSQLSRLKSMRHATILQRHDIFVDFASTTPQEVSE
jgi:hypothetical protein